MINKDNYTTEQKMQKLALLGPLKALARGGGSVVGGAANALGYGLRNWPVALPLSAAMAYLAWPKVEKHLKGYTYADRWKNRPLSPLEAASYKKDTKIWKNLLRGELPSIEVKPQNPGGMVRVASDKKQEKKAFLNPIAGARAVKNLARPGSGLVRPGYDISDMIALGTVPIAMMGAKDLFSPLFTQMGEAVSRRFIPEETRLGLRDEELKAEAISRAKVLGAENASQIMEDLAKKEKELEEATKLAPTRSAIINQLAEEDAIIASGVQTPEGLQTAKDAMKTVAIFAPDLATHKSTVQSVIREALTSLEAGMGGLSFQTVKQLADVQKSISDSRKDSITVSLKD